MFFSRRALVAAAGVLCFALTATACGSTPTCAPARVSTAAPATAAPLTVAPPRPPVSMTSDGVCGVLAAISPAALMGQPNLQPDADPMLGYCAVTDADLNLVTMNQTGRNGSSQSALDGYQASRKADLATSQNPKALYSYLPPAGIMVPDTDAAYLAKRKDTSMGYQVAWVFHGMSFHASTQTGVPGKRISAFDLIELIDTAIVHQYLVPTYRVK